MRWLGGGGGPCASCTPRRAEVSAPAGAHMGERRPLEMGMVLAIEELLLGEVVAASEARLGIEARELRVGDRGQEGEDEREPDTRPNIARYRAAVGRGGRGLQLVGDPEERTRHDQRHRVHGDAGEPERRLDGCLFWHVESPPAGPGEQRPCHRASDRNPQSTRAGTPSPAFYSCAAQKTGSSPESHPRRGPARGVTGVAAMTQSPTKVTTRPPSTRMRQRRPPAPGPTLPRTPRVTSRGCPAPTPPR